MYFVQNSLRKHTLGFVSICFIDVLRAKSLWKHTLGFVTRIELRNDSAARQVV
ncbi:hypothetical protein NST99_01230 [Paenibacillus sp. FSL L8-0470]|uniref:hypothetical protein n=1 Tax=unclassified Paenibacillus TaxID=185978 RepID=UPI0030F8F018